MTSTSSDQGGAAAPADGVQSQLMELSRAMFRFSWAMTVFGAQQATNMVTAAGSAKARSTAAEAFDAVANAVEDQFGGVFRGAYKTGRECTPGFGRQEPEVAASKG